MMIGSLSNPAWPLSQHAIFAACLVFWTSNYAEKLVFQ